jgi:hypothetical protein
MKQAKHVQPTGGSRLQIMVCDWGGFIVGSSSRDDCFMGGQAAFTSADECAEWVRGFLKNRANDMFGAKKPEKK